VFCYIAINRLKWSVVIQDHCGHTPFELESVFTR